MQVENKLFSLLKIRCPVGKVSLAACVRTETFSKVLSGFSIEFSAKSFNLFRNFAVEVELVETDVKTHLIRPDIYHMEIM
jgi:hypothetical protein